MDQVQDDTDASPDRFGRASIILFALGIVLLSALLATWRAVQDHQLTLRASRHELLLFATTLAKQVESMVRDSVGVAAAGARAMQHAAMAEERQQILKRQLVGDHYLRALFVLGKDGVVIANREDPVAARLLKEAEGYLLRDFEFVFDPQMPGPVGLGGGIIAHLTGLPGAIGEVMRKAGHEPDIRLVRDGSVGAVVLALRAVGIPVDEAMVQRIAASLASRAAAVTPV